MLIRAIMPEDEPLIVDFHKRISEESVYTRWERIGSFCCIRLHEDTQLTLEVCASYSLDISLT